MKQLIWLFSFLHAAIAVLFGCAALVLMGVAALTGWSAVSGGIDTESGQQVIQAIGLLAAAVVALQITQTIAEEEVIRDVQVSGPTRVRRFLSRFFVVIIVALAIEGLVATLKALHEDMSQLVFASALIVSTALLLAAWGVFIRLNRSAEELEPEGMEEAKSEDEKLKA
jgi:hypothetical protein